MSAASEPETGDFRPDEDDTFDCDQLGLSADAYEFGGHLGDGGFGRVFKAVCKRTGKEVAIKVLEKRKVHQRNMSSRVISEISIHQRLRHPIVLQLYSYFEDTTNVYLVLELCHRGNLHDYVKQNGCLSEDKVRYFLKQIVTGLRYLHQNRIIHRDLTLANLLLTKDNKVKISDFGLATELSEDRTNKTMCGTPNYISPEVSSQGVQGLEVDVWSLGIMLYTMLVGKAPFDTKDPKSTIDNARKLKYDIPGILHPDAIDLIAKLLRERPKERLTLAQILEHPFMQQALHERSASNDSGNDSVRSATSNCLAASTPVTAATAASSSSSSRRSHPQPTPATAPIPLAPSTPHLQAPGAPRRRSGSLRRCNSDGGHSRNSEGYASAVQSEGSPAPPPPAPMSLRPQHPEHQRRSDPFDRSCASNPTAGCGDSRQRNQQRKQLSPKKSMPIQPPPPPPQPPTPLQALMQPQPPPPLRTARLEPCRIAKGLAVFTLAADGSLTVEQLKVRKAKRTAVVARAMRIDASGRRVQLLASLNGGEGIPLPTPAGDSAEAAAAAAATGRPVEVDWLTAEQFVYPDLPETAARLYQFADSFIGILRSNTAKVILHSERARCVLFENLPEPDFAVYFYDGRRAARRGAGRRLTIDGRPVELRGLTPSDAEIVHYVNETYDQVRRIESVLTGVSGHGRSACFPVTIGRAPALEPGTSVSTSSCSSAPAHACLSPTASPAKLLVANVQQLSDSDTRVLFSDGSLLEIRQDRADLRSLDYTDPFGHRQRFESSERRRLADMSLPRDIQCRLGLLISCPALLPSGASALPACLCA